jgi:hypothetical protein
MEARYHIPLYLTFFLRLCAVTYVNRARVLVWAVCAPSSVPRRSPGRPKDGFCGTTVTHPDVHGSFGLVWAVGAPHGVDSVARPARKESEDGPSLPTLTFFADHVYCVLGARGAPGAPFRVLPCPAS